MLYIEGRCAYNKLKKGKDDDDDDDIYFGSIGCHSRRLVPEPHTFVWGLGIMYSHVVTLGVN